MLFNIIMILSTFSTSVSPIPMDGEKGTYASIATFPVKGMIGISLFESFGFTNIKETEVKTNGNQTTMNLYYSPFSHLMLALGLDYYHSESSVKGLYLKMKMPFFNVKHLRSAFTPNGVFYENNKPAYGMNIDFDFIPFTKKTLPLFVFTNSVNFVRNNSINEIEFSSLLSLEQGLFHPFVEYYSLVSSLSGKFNSNNSRFSTGLSFQERNFGIKAGLEISLDEYSKKDFDYRITGAISYSFQTNKIPTGTLHIVVIDKQTEATLPSKITLSGKQIEKIFESESGKYTIENLPLGIYTILVESPEYREVKAPIFVKPKIIDRTYELQKKIIKKGGDFPKDEM